MKSVKRFIYVQTINLILIFSICVKPHRGVGNYREQCQKLLESGKKMTLEEFISFCQADEVAVAVGCGFGSGCLANAAKRVSRKGAAHGVKFLSDGDCANSVYFNAPPEYWTDVSFHFFKGRPVFQVVGRCHSRRNRPAEIFPHYLSFINFPYLFSTQMI